VSIDITPEAVKRAVIQCYETRHVKYGTLIAALADRIAELEAHCDRLGRGGAERYWEERWRDEAARVAELEAALEQFEDRFDQAREMTETTKASELVPCPFCRECLSLTKSNMWAHAQQSQGGCILSSMAIPADDIKQVTAWNTRAPLPNEDELVEIIQGAIGMDSTEIMRAIFAEDCDQTHTIPARIITALRPYLNRDKQEIIIGLSEWCDSAERSEWEFMAKMLKKCIDILPHKLSGAEVALGIALDRSKEGWRTKFVHQEHTENMHNDCDGGACIACNEKNHPEKET